MVDGDTTKILMEFCARGDLHNYIQKFRKKLTKGNIQSLAAELGTPLMFASFEVTYVRLMYYMSAWE